MTHERWTRLMPDAYLEAQEIKAALLSLRPQWAAAEKEFKDFNKVRYDWLRRKGGFWERARKDVQFPMTDESLRGKVENKLAQQEVRDIRDMFKGRNQSGALTHLQSVTIEPNGSIAKMTTVDYWRLTSSYILLKELQIYASPYREWLDCEVDIHALTADMEDFENMWFRELQPEQVKRQWLRGSMEFLQRWHKPSDGSPVDSQLTSHLIDVDYFVTADKNFARCVERIHAEAPFVTAKPLKISGGREGINELVAFSANHL